MQSSDDTLPNVRLAVFAALERGFRVCGVSLVRGEIHVRMDFQDYIVTVKKA